MVRDPVYPSRAGRPRAGLILSKSSQMRQHASPAPVALYKNIRGPFMRAEFLSHEFALRTGYRGNYRAVSVNAHTEIFGFHHVVR